MPTRNTSVERRLPLAQATCIASVASAAAPKRQRPLILAETNQQSSKQKSRPLQRAALAGHQQKCRGTEQQDADAAIDLRLDRCAERERGGQQIGDHERDEQPADYRSSRTINRAASQSNPDTPRQNKTK